MTSRHSMCMPLSMQRMQHRRNSAPAVVTPIAVGDVEVVTSIAVGDVAVVTPIAVGDVTETTLRRQPRYGGDEMDKLLSRTRTSSLPDKLLAKLQGMWSHSQKRQKRRQKDAVPELEK